MKKLSKQLLADAVRSGRNRLGLSQAELSGKTGINRSILSNLENGQYQTERRYIVSPIWEGTAPISRVANALTANARIVEGSIVRVPATGQASLKIDDIYGEV